MFSQKVIEALGHYVYFLVDPRDDYIFYVGKGVGNRVFQHIQEAGDSQNQSHKVDRIREIDDAGLQVVHKILRHGLKSEDAAFEVEAAAIDMLGISNLTNQQSGHYANDYGLRSTEEIIAIYEAEPVQTDLPIILVNVNKKYFRGMTTDELYHAVKEKWVIGERRQNAKFAVATYRGLTREVFEIDSWYPVVSSSDKIKSRWGFNGHIASEDVQKILKHKSINHLFKKGEAAPIKYVNVPKISRNSKSSLQSNTLKNSGPAAIGEVQALDTDLPLLLFNINRTYDEGMTTDEIYSAVKEAWIVGRQRHKAQYAVAVYRGIAGEVFEIESWYQVEQDSRADRARWGFSGRPAPENVEASIKGKAIKHLFPNGAVNPVRYLNI